MARIPKIRHMRHRMYERLRHSKIVKAFLAERAATTEQAAADLFDEMKVPGSAAEVAAIPDPTP